MNSALHWHLVHFIPEGAVAAPAQRSGDPLATGFRRSDDCSCKSCLCTCVLTSKTAVKCVKTLPTCLCILLWLVWHSSGIHCELPRRLWHQCRWSWWSGVRRTKAASFCGTGHPHAAQDLQSCGLWEAVSCYSCYMLLRIISEVISSLA